MENNKKKIIKKKKNIWMQVGVSMKNISDSSRSRCRTQVGFKIRASGRTWFPVNIVNIVNKERKKKQQKKKNCKLR